MKEVEHDVRTTCNVPSMTDTPMKESEKTESKSAKSEKQVTSYSTKQQNFGYSFEDESEGNCRH